VFILYVFTALLFALTSVVLIWPTDRLLALALAPFVASAAVVVLAVLILLTASARRGNNPLVSAASV
jgi:hypothetical protein